VLIARGVVAGEGERGISRLLLVLIVRKGVLKLTMANAIPTKAPILLTAGFQSAPRLVRIFCSPLTFNVSLCRSIQSSFSSPFRRPPAGACASLSSAVC